MNLNRDWAVVRKTTGNVWSLWEIDAWEENSGVKKRERASGLRKEHEPCGFCESLAHRDCSDPIPDENRDSEIWGDFLDATLLA